ncbi:MAG: glycoside hydrolase family 88 protein [Saprospiraceae bacterium]|nr:glycoside hydrolase family 88 protein [Saprospiraceae bacterium]
MMNINEKLTIEQLLPKVELLWELSAHKIRRIEQEYDPSQGAPVFTRAGKYTTRGWTEWTQGFQYGSSILQYDATGDEAFLEIGRKATLEKMASHVGHFGVHDHGFNNVSTYGNLLRLMKEGKIPQVDWEQHFYELALKLSGAVQAKRWTELPDGGYMYSFNGPHSLFVDTIRTVRAVMVSHELDYAIWGENDRRVSLLERGIQHALATAKYAIYYGEGRDSYDEWGRTAHESIFNTNDGNFRCPNAQQGFSGFTTWTRGLAWAIAGYPEQLEYLKTLSEEELAPYGGFSALEEIYLKAAKATCDFYIDNTPTDGVPYWDTGAPQIHQLGDYLNRVSDPFNDFEPIDSSAAAIAAQGLLRLGKYLGEAGKRYWQAGLTVLDSLLQAPYLSEDPDHQGLLLHTIYHQPNGWDYVPPGSKIPYGESCMWGDYHLREVTLYAQRLIKNETYYTFYGSVK